MKLTKRHINELFDVEGGDGSWVYQLVDVSKTELLFYCFGSCRYEIEPKNKFKDWRRFKPQAHKESHVKYGWTIGRRDAYAYVSNAGASK